MFGATTDSSLREEWLKSHRTMSLGMPLPIQVQHEGAWTGTLLRYGEEDKQAAAPTDPFGPICH